MIGATGPSTDGRTRGQSAVQIINGTDGGGRARCVAGLVHCGRVMGVMQRNWYLI